MQLKNYYTGKKADTGYLYDLRGSNDGQLKGSTKPSVNSNGYLSFLGGHGNTEGNYNNVEFSINDYQYNHNNDFTFFALARSSKNDDTKHAIFSVNHGGSPSIRFFITGGNEGRFYLSDTNSNAFSVMGENICDGKWHSIFSIHDSASGYIYIIIDNKWFSNTDSFFGNFYNSASKALLGCRYISSTGNYIWDLEGDIAVFANFSGIQNKGLISDYNSYFKGFF